MTKDMIAAKLAATGLRLPEAEMTAFEALILDMESAAAVAQQPLTYLDEPSNVLSLKGATEA
jgi:hypothetical protein